MRFCEPTGEFEVNNNAKESETNIQPKRFVNKRIFLAGRTREISSRQVRLILPARVANHNEEFASSFPLADIAC